MLMALVTMLLLSILAGELVYQSGVFSSLAFRQRDQLRATLLARSGLRLGILQIKAAKLAKAKVKSMGLGENASIVDKIWQTPLILPPPAMPGTTDSGMAGFRKSLGFEGTVAVTIMGESTRISINQLIWPFAGAKPEGAEGTAAAGNATGGVVMDPNNPLGTPATGAAPGLTKEQKETQMKKQREDFTEIFNSLLEKKRQNDDAFREKYPNLSGEQLVGNLAAWMSPDVKLDGDNRDKNDYYQRVEPFPYAIKEAPIASESEYHMIKLFDETITKLVSDNFTVQTTNSLDVNKASLLLIHSLIPELSPDALLQLDKRRKDEAQGGPFKDAKEFFAYLNTIGRYEDTEKKLKDKNIKVLDAETAYRVVVTAQSGASTKTWVADIGPLPPNLDPPNPQGANPQAQPQPQPQAPAQPPPGAAGTAAAPGSETGDIDSLNIVYLKAD